MKKLFASLLLVFCSVFVFATTPALDSNRIISFTTDRTVSGRDITFKIDANNSVCNISSSSFSGTTISLYMQCGDGNVWTFDFVKSGSNYRISGNDYNSFIDIIKRGVDSALICQSGNTIVVKSMLNALDITAFNSLIARATTAQYMVGGKGPAGGYIFYDCDADNDTGNKDGLKSVECGWRYLEAAPADVRVVNGKVSCDSNDMWYDLADTKYQTGYYSNEVMATGLGTGQSNTTKIVRAIKTTAHYAATLCNDLVCNGVSDWFLPSEKELSLMSSIISVSSYLSSSSVSGQSGKVRPIRAFSEACPNGHNFTISGQDSTCYSQGALAHTCEDCGYSYEETIQKKSHSYNEQRICTVCGHDLTDDMIGGRFTIDANGSQVQFSRGNLWYNTSAGTWNFEDSQLNYQSSWNANHVDKFYWSRSASVAVAEKYSDPNASKDDKFFAEENFNVNGYDGWGTLSYNEWRYLLFKRSTKVTGVGTSNARYAKVIVNGVKGLILFPDSMVWNTSTMGRVPAYINDDSSSINSDWSKATGYTSSQFKRQEEAGIVFLPCAGRRFGSSFDSVGSSGHYWTSTPGSGNSGEAGSVYFYYGLVDTITVDGRSHGYSVRLVTYAKESTHSHTFDQENTDTKYLVTEATCTESAVYYKSCTCGEKGVETFKYGKPYGHNYDAQGICTVCGDKKTIIDSLYGTFTVDSNGSQVKFSKGNLWYDTSTGTWNFEDSQLNYQSSWNANHVDKFYWSRSASVAVARDYSDSSRSTSDKFFASENFSVNGYDGWGTLSYDEWRYLLFTRSTNVTGVGTTSNARFARVIENGVKGLMLFPDSMAWDTSTMGSVPIYINSTNSLNQNWTNATSYTLSQFEKQEEAGIVFLPCAGDRNGSSFYGVGRYGLYWTSTPYSGSFNGAGSVGFNYYGVDTSSYYTRDDGRTVRLVTRVGE